jgi:hypothetical protein
VVSIAIKVLANQSSVRCEQLFNTGAFNLDGAVKQDTSAFLEYTPALLRTTAISGSRSKDSPHHLGSSRFHSIAWLEHRCQHRPANARLEKDTNHIVPRPAPVDGQGQHSGRGRSAPSGTHDGEGRRRLGYEASSAEAQEKPAVCGADFGNAERPLRTNAQNSTNGSGKKHAEAPEQCGYEGSTVR